MTEISLYEACKNLEEWGCAYSNWWVVCDESDPEDTVHGYILEDLIAFAEQVAEKKWPNDAWYRAMTHYPNSKEGKYHASIRIVGVVNIMADGESDISDWWAVYHLIAAMIGEE